MYIPDRKVERSDVVRIGGLNKLTTQDYPGKLACIIFVQGCNFNCGYCQNRELIEASNEELTTDDILDYLVKRKKMLDGVVISGGEPTIWKDLSSFIKQIKDLGYDIKLDTNGYKPETIKELLNEKLIDYIAMDIKAIPDKYSKIVGKKIDFEKIKESIEIIKQSKIDHEFRTTIIKGIHEPNDLKDIIKLVGNSKYFIQNFQDSEYVKDKELASFSKQELEDIKKNLKTKSNVEIRYI